MSALESLSDELHRTVKLALDTGEAGSVDDAVRIFSAYRAQFIVGPEVAESAALQAALLTAVNCAARTLLGGVTVVGAHGELRVTVPPFRSIAEAAKVLGARTRSTPANDVPTVYFGASSDEGREDPIAIRVVVRGWSGGVVPLAHKMVGDEGSGLTTAGVLAGALAVSEIFQRLRGYPLACRRAAGLSLWAPEKDWLKDEQGPPLARLPSSGWLVGLGNLGQAYLWTLGLLPYSDGALDLVLQDHDVLAKSNVSTSMLTAANLLGQRKARAMAAWAERRGFRANIIERRFAADFKVSRQDPAVALIGVDNPLARQAIEYVGFERIFEAGLGRGPEDFLGIDLHTFPAAAPARTIWQSTATGDADITQPAYRELLESSGDRCGTVRVAGRSIGSPFVGAVASALVVAEFLRLAIGGARNELVSCHLRDLGSRTVIRGAGWPPFNPGTLAMPPAPLPEEEKRAANIPTAAVEATAAI